MHQVEVKDQPGEGWIILSKIRSYPSWEPKVPLVNSPLIRPYLLGGG